MYGFSDVGCLDYPEFSCRHIVVLGPTHCTGLNFEQQPDSDVHVRGVELPVSVRRSIMSLDGEVV